MDNVVGLFPIFAQMIVQELVVCLLFGDSCRNPREWRLTRDPFALYFKRCEGIKHGAVLIWVSPIGGRLPDIQLVQHKLSLVIVQVAIHGLI